MLAALAAATIGMTYQPPITRPEDVGARGYALVFSREDRESFSVLIKDAGTKWEQVPKAEETVEKPCEFSWLVFHTIVPNMDFVLRTNKKAGEDIDASVEPSDDLTQYFEDDGMAAENNFGLHDIY
jgi:hypothetical protein